MINISKIKLDGTAICDNSKGNVLLLSVADGYEYVDGKAASNINHQKYTVVLIDNDFEKIIIKVAGWFMKTWNGIKRIRQVPDYRYCSCLKQGCALANAVV